MKLEYHPTPGSTRYYPDHKPGDVINVRNEVAKQRLSEGCWKEIPAPAPKLGKENPEPGKEGN